MYENKTYDTIKANILENITTVNKNEGSFINETISPVALEIGTVYREFEKILAIMFLEDTWDEYLDKKALEFGIERKKGTYADGKVTITGNDNTVIPIGTLVSTNSNLIFSTTVEATILGGSVEIPIKSEEIGSKYNVLSNTIINLPVSIVGITSINNNLPTTGGTNIETDEELKSRLLLQIQNPSTSGNEAHYKLWTMSVDGVGACKIFSLWNGPGTVQVVIVDSNKKVANETLINSVADYIETQRPIGPTVSVISAAEKVINVDVTLTINTGYTLETIKTSIEENINKYLQDIAFNADYVSYARIGGIILDTDGVIDYSNLKLNNLMANIAISAKEVAVLGTVTVA
jgi:uncharacterized phage protein gp47/JayE